MGENNLSKYVSSMVPDSVQQKTVGELLASDDTELIIKKGKMVAKKNVGNRRVVLSVENMNGFSEMAVTCAERNLSRDEQEKLVKSLRKEGRKQQEIADIIGKSQPFVSKLLKGK